MDCCSGHKFNGNGSLQADKSRGIAYITYDLNNNPKQIYFMNGSVTKYVYSASGQKLRAVHYTAKPNISRTWGVKPAELTSSQILQADSTDYLLGGSLVMKNGKVDKYIFEGGYAQASASSSTSDNFTFYYYTPDHLGNIREVVDASGNVQQVTNYYPFGATYAESTAADFQPYKYNGKELDKMHGLNTYDYGARQHDPILARWDRIDPLCEKYYNVSPYAYCANNPIKNIDPDGRMPTDREAAILSQHVYDGKVELEGGWEMYGERQQMKNGLTYGIYCRDTSEGGTEYVLAFGGTFECSDYGTDIKQAMELPASQYGMAKELGEKFNSLYEGYERTIVGHSLGGGLCQVASMATGIPAITINSAAVHNNTKNALGISNAPTDQIKNIIVRGDIVTSAQDLSVFANSGLNLVGQRKYIGPREKSYSMIKQFTNHLIKTAKKYLNK